MFGLDAIMLGQGYYPMFDFRYLLFMLPAMALAGLAQLWLSSAYARGQSVPVRMTGFMAARQILDAAGLSQVQIEPIPGQLSDHYDPRADVLRLSEPVYRGQSAAAVGIAAHEAGHALQKHSGYLPLVIRNFAVPAANFGSGASMFIILFGMILRQPMLLGLGIIAFSFVVFFQLINLPVEWNASSRAKRVLQELGIVMPQEMGAVNSVLNAAALTYVAGALQSVMTLLYYLMIFMGSGRRRQA